MRTSKLCAISALSLLCCGRFASASVVYSNDFNSSSTSGFSTTAGATSTSNPIQISTSPSGTQTFLGEFGNQTITLNLTGLAAHSTDTVTFDLYILKTMDGNGPAGGGADPWSLTENGNPVIYTSFANYPGDVQSFGGVNPGGGYFVGPVNTTSSTGTYAPDTGAAATNTLGYNVGIPVNDAIYRQLTFTFSDSSPTLALNFIGGQNQSLADESWGLDNVTVSTAGVPEPAALALIVPAAAAMLRRRRRPQ